MIFSIIRDPNAGVGEKIIMIFAFLLAILTAIVFHEVAHGYIAYKNGDYTAKFAGRLSLNPIKHFDPLGFLMLAIVGFGWAKPVPVDSRNFTNYKKGMIMVSFAGVVTNLLLAIAFAIIFSIIQLIYGACIEAVAANMFLQYLFLFFNAICIYSMVVNLTLMAFNILPICPLDGFRVVETLAKPGNRYVDFMRKYGMLILFGLLLLGNFLGGISPWLDPIGSFISWVTNGILGIFEKIFGFNIM